jgi:MoaA/NifB/PqqE/SkfB family radical SAM enzyme
MKVKEIYNKIWLKVFYSDRLRNLYKLTLRYRPLKFIPYPTAIEIEPTTMPCPVKCRICENPWFPDKVRRAMSFDEFKLIIDQFPKLKWLGPTGIGEAWTNPDFPSMLEYAKSKKVFIEIYDNFLFLDKDRIKFLMENVGRIWISIDGCTKETYEKIRLKSNFEKVVENLQNFFEMKRKFRSEKPKIDFHYIINKLNLHEVPDFVDFVSTFNIPGEFMILFTKILHPFDQTKDIYIDKVPDEIIKETERRAKKNKIHVQWAGDIPTKEAKHAWRREELREIKHCCAWLQPFFFSTGDVVPCCRQNEFGKREWQIERSMGNIFETRDFKKIWFGPRYTQLKKMIRANLTPPYCEFCPDYTSFPTPKEVANKFLLKS